MKVFFDGHTGIAIYERQENGDLVGRYTCTESSYTDAELCMKFFDEKDKKIESTSTNNPIEGKYKCKYDSSNGKFHGDLTIYFFNNFYYFKWSAKKNYGAKEVVHEGIGKLDEAEKRIAVTYWGVNLDNR